MAHIEELISKEMFKESGKKGNDDISGTLREFINTFFVKIETNVVDKIKIIVKKNTQKQSRKRERWPVIETIQEISKKTKNNSTRSCRFDRNMKMDTTLETFDVCFDDVAINKVRSIVIINVMSMRPFSMLMDCSSLVDIIESKKNSNSFVLSTILFLKN